MKIFILLIIIIILSSCSCMTVPDRDDYFFSECYVAMDCMYRMKKEHDKSICSPLITACNDALREQRCTNRLTYCREFTPKGMTESECRLWLNQK